MEHGKNVLVEKAFTANARQAEELFAMAEEKKVFITDAKERIIRIRSFDMTATEDRQYYFC